MKVLIQRVRLIDSAHSVHETKQLLLRYEQKLVNNNVFETAQLINDRTVNVASPMQT